MPRSASSFIVQFLYPTVRLERGDTLPRSLPASLDDAFLPQTRELGQKLCVNGLSRLWHCPLGGPGGSLAAPVAYLFTN
jgi:hypothetical protein